MSASQDELARLRRIIFMSGEKQAIDSYERLVARASPDVAARVRHVLDIWVVLASSDLGRTFISELDGSLVDAAELVALAFGFGEPRGAPIVDYLSDVQVWVEAELQEPVIGVERYVPVIHRASNAILQASRLSFVSIGRPLLYFASNAREGWFGAQQGWLDGSPALPSARDMWGAMKVAEVDRQPVDMWQAWDYLRARVPSDFIYMMTNQPGGIRQYFGGEAAPHEPYDIVGPGIVVGRRYDGEGIWWRTGIFEADIRDCREMACSVEWATSVGDDMDDGSNGPVRDGDDLHKLALYAQREMNRAGRGVESRLIEPLPQGPYVWFPVAPLSRVYEAGMEGLKDPDIVAIALDEARREELSAMMAPGVMAFILRALGVPI